MNRSIFTRRDFLGGSASLLASGATAFASDNHQASRAEHQGCAAASQRPPVQSENGVIFHRDVHHSELMKGFPPPKDRRVTWENWAETTERLRYAHLNPAFVFKTTSIDRGNSPMWALHRDMIDHQRLLGAQVLWGETAETASRISVSDWLGRSRIDALVALHDGHIVAEVYCGEMTPRTPHIIWCGSKAVFATVLAPFLVNGELDEHAQVTRYVKEFEHTAFKGATIRQLLDQMTGVQCDDWIEPDKYEKLGPAAQREWSFGTPEFRHANNDYARSSRALGMFPPLNHERSAGYYDFLLNLVDQNRPHGTSFRYSDYNPMALQLILERVTGTSYVEHLGRLVGELGFEWDATLILDPIGTPIGNYGLALTSRDWARWGQMLCNLGHVGSGRDLPGIRELVQDIRRDPGADRVKGEWTTPMPNVGYRSQFWTASSVRGRAPLVQAWGWCLQKCLVDVERKNVVVQLASFWDQDPDNVRSRQTANHGDLAIWTFLEEVLPKLIGRDGDHDGCPRRQSAPEVLRG